MFFVFSRHSFHCLFIFFLFFFLGGGESGGGARRAAGESNLAPVDNADLGQFRFTIDILDSPLLAPI